MDDLRIITNNIPRELFTWHELTEKERDWFDYLDEDSRDSLRFARYRGEAYDVGDFVRIVSKPAGFAHYAAPGSPLLAWDGIATDSYFSATVVRYVPDSSYELVVMGRVLA